MPATSRKTTRVSTSDSADARASSASSKRKTGSSAASSTSSSTRSSAASSGVIPTVAARNASNKKVDRKERRLEDVLDDTIVADDARRVDISMGAFEPVKAASASSTKRSRQDAEAAARKLKQATARREEPPKTKRKLRQTLGDESEDDFIFSREPARRNGATASSTSAASSSSTAPTSAAARAQASRNGVPTSLSSRTVFEPLPDEAGGETPIIRRNQAFRAGLENKPRRPTGREAEQQSRRSSLNLKGQRRVSSLRDGTVAHPHEDVPDYELYRHCSDQLPPVVRMKHIISWIIKRSLNIATGKAQLPVRPRDAAKKTKGKAKESNELPTFNESELKLTRSRESEVTAVLEQVLADLNEGVFGISWMGQNDEAKSKHLQPHPRNESNRKAAAQLSAIVEAMRSESQAWSKELTRLEDYEAETARLEALLQDDSTAESGDVIAWDRQDLDEAGLQQLRDAEAAVEWLGRLQGDATTETTKAKPRSKGRSSKAANARQDEEAADLKGTEHDARWNDVEFNVDLLRSQSHQFAQLESLASRYVRTVSAHAAQALRDRTSSSSALAGTSSSSAKGGRGKAAAKKGRGGGGSGQLEMLLSGVRESRSITQPTAEASTAADQSVADVSASMAAVEPDESDPTDLLRALARMRD